MNAPDEFRNLSDHDAADLLGERGLRCETNFAENSAGMPLIMAGPGFRGAKPDAPEEAGAIGEYGAEITPHPIVMVRRGRFKSVHCGADPEQLQAGERVGERS